MPCAATFDGACVPAGDDAEAAKAGGAAVAAVEKEKARRRAKKRRVATVSAAKGAGTLACAATAHVPHKKSHAASSVPKPDAPIVASAIGGSDAIAAPARPLHARIAAAEGEAPVGSARLTAAAPGASRAPRARSRRS